MINIKEELEGISSMNLSGHLFFWTLHKIWKPNVFLLACGSGVEAIPYTRTTSKFKHDINDTENKPETKKYFCRSTQIHLKNESGREFGK